ncbi:hypothetical protein [Aeromonas hydrophila]|uniref:hypothetical protein n=1 Tax=Aeromonas hydrophila TaxID=644 RepID=UPI0012D32FE1|nr:hypothetical protein [Aeromonas hydrophila]
MDILDELLSNPQTFKDLDSDFIQAYLSYMSSLVSGSYESLSPDAHSYSSDSIEKMFVRRFRSLVSEYNFIKNKNIYRLIQNTASSLLTKSLNSYFYEREEVINNLGKSVRESLSSQLDDIRSQSSSLNALAKKVQDGYERERAESTSLIKELQQVFDENKNKYSILFDDLENATNGIKDRGIEIDNILQMANQQGMASSFQKRVKELFIPRMAWLGVFAITILALIIISYHIVIPGVTAIDGFNWEVLLKHIPMTLPVIWVAWFSSKQYTQMSKLKEDYEYKFAVAMAYHGYKREAMELNSEMHGKLLESILSHFSDNPIRLYSSNESTTPLEALIKNDKLSELIKSIKS